MASSLPTTVSSFTVLPEKHPAPVRPRPGAYAIPAGCFHLLTPKGLLPIPRHLGQCCPLQLFFILWKFLKGRNHNITNPKYTLTQSNSYRYIVPILFPLYLLLSLHYTLPFGLTFPLQPLCHPSHQF